MLNTIKKYFNLKKMTLMIVGSLLLASSVKYFISPVGLYTGGLMGIILIIETVTNGFISFGILYFIFNVPLLFLSWFKLGKRFTFYTIISVIFVSMFSEILPNIQMISSDKLIMSLFGGLLTGFAVVLMLQAGGSAGGADIISLYFAERTGRPIGFIALIFNIVVLTLTALLFDLEIVLYTLIGSYTASVVTDRLHTRYQKLTITINTSNAEGLINEFQEKSPRGVTIIPAIGGYTRMERQLLYIVVTSFELTSVLELVKKYDENAFINVTKSAKVFGNFTSPSIDET
ncbi:MAG: YitT family protein [Bacilli bacterium]